jgi:hypothetical protein
MIHKFHLHSSSINNWLIDIQHRFILLRFNLYFPIFAFASLTCSFEGLGSFLASITT